MTWLADPEMWLALATLTALEIVLGVDNVISRSDGVPFGLELDDER